MTEGISELLCRIEEDIRNRDDSGLKNRIQLVREALLSSSASREEGLQCLQRLYGLLTIPGAVGMDWDGILYESAEDACRRWEIPADTIANWQKEVLSIQMERIKQKLIARDGERCREEVVALEDLLVSFSIQETATQEFITRFDECLVEIAAHGRDDADDCGAYALLSAVDTSSHSLPGLGCERLHDVIVKHYPQFSNHSVCYGALEILVDLFPGEKAVVTVSNLLKTCTGTGRLLALEALSWILDGPFWGVAPPGALLREKVMKAFELAAEDRDEEYARLARTCLSLENEK